MSYPLEPFIPYLRQYLPYHGDNVDRARVRSLETYLMRLYTETGNITKNPKAKRIIIALLYYLSNTKNQPWLYEPYSILSNVKKYLAETVGDKVAEDITGMIHSILSLASPDGKELGLASERVLRHIIPMYEDEAGEYLSVESGDFYGTTVVVIIEGKGKKETEEYRFH